jgi:vancomycin resistance protein YoaR
MFRAAINSGFEITQRYPHAFPVKYYNPQGFDATIYPPFPDLKFINNTPNYLLVQTRIEGYNLIFEIYGTDDGRKVEISGPYQYDIGEDGSMKARLVQKVYDKNQELIINETFYSNYKSPDLYPVEKNPLE